MTKRPESAPRAAGEAADGPATTYERIFDWARRLGVRPLQIGLGCCATGAIGIAAALDPRHDLNRFGAEAFRAAPRRSDLLIIAGSVSGKMAPLLRRLWDELPDPKWALALGCAGGGGPCRSYAVARGLDGVIPIAVHVPGCPPSPEALLAGLRELEARMGRLEARA